MPDFASSFPLQFLFFSTDQNVDFYSRCCHFFSDIILADLYTHTHTHKNNKNAFRRTTTRRTTPRRRRKRPIRFVSVEVRCRLGNGTFIIRYHFFYFQKSFCFRSVWNLCVCWRSLLSLSLLSLSSYYQLQYKKAQASFWTAGTFYFFFSFVLISVLLDFFFFFALALDISKINLLLLSLKLSLSLSDFNRGSRFTRRHEALGKAHRGREALHLARVGVLCRFGRDRLGKLGRSFHEGDPNPGGTFFVLFSPPLSEREMCASPREFVFVFSARSSSRERDTHRKPLFSQARAFYGFQIAIENIHSGTFIRWSFLNAARSSPSWFFFPFLLSLSFDTKALRGWRQGEE